MKICIFQRKHKGRKQQNRCGLDGSVRNECTEGICPHFTPTRRYKLWKRRNFS